MRIGIDIDGVIADFVPSFLEFYNEKHGINIKVKDILHYDIHIAMGIDEKQLWKLMGEYWKTRYFNNIKPIKNSKKIINILKQDHELFIVTARIPPLFEYTEKWLKQYFSNCFTEIFYTGDFNQKGELKSDVCKKHKIDILVEDSLKISNQCAEQGIKVLLFDQSWNQIKKLHENITRVEDWKETLAIIEKLDDN